MRLKLSHNQKGQTIIEVMAAIFVITIGMMGALALTVSNLRNQRIGAGRLISTQLSREGIESVRAIRDTNWLQEETWDNGLTNPTSHCAVLDADGKSLTFQTCGTLADPGYQLSRDPATGIYSPTIGDPTRYFRRLTLHPICLNGITETVVTSGTCGGDESIGLEVTSETAWNDAVSVRTATIVEKIYNWR